jgi:hypothetical protein
MGTDPETITEAELAEALGRRHPDKPREGAEFLARALFADIKASRTAEANAAPLAAESPRPPSPEPDTAAMGSGEGSWRDRAEAAEHKLARIAQICRTIGQVSAERIMAIIGTQGEAPELLGDLRAELGEARSEAQMIRTHAHRYLVAVYGPDYVFRAPETFGNLVERWIWAVAAEVPEMAHASIADIERRCAERDACQCGSEGEECRG